MRVVLDTNVFVSGLMLPRSTPGKIVQAWKNTHFDLALSEPMLTELARVLAYPKISQRLNWTPQKLERFILLLRFKSEIVALNGAVAEVPRDPDDNVILATYLASQSEYLITGDNDLLSLRPQYAILTPAEFVHQF